MSFRKIVTAIAWGLAFESTAEMALGGAYGAWGGGQFAKGHSVEEITAAYDKTWSTLNKVVPPIAGLIGLSLGLMGRLPGTEDK